jgi:cytochrome c6
MIPHTRLVAILSGALLLALLTVQPPPSRAHDDATTKLFRIQCSTCHGMDGRGQTTIGKQLGMKDWKDGKTLAVLKDDEIRKIIGQGIKGSDGKERMPPFGKLTREQVDALVIHVRSLK